MTRIIDRLKAAFAGFRSPNVQASFDLTRTTHENKKHWADATALSGRATFYKQERKTARERSRMECANNSWYAGMVRTAANHVIGVGPRLQVQTTDAELNARIERAWHKWSTTIGLNEKLHVMFKAYWVDGEAFAMRTGRPSLYPVQLDVRLYESDQVSQPYWHVLDPTLEDGKRVDPLGNPVEYWIYDHHPGDLNIGHANLLSGRWYIADEVIHLYRADRPGQLRGFPRCAPAIDWLAHMRRFSKATLSAAEQAALWAVFIKTTGSSVTPAQMSQDLMTVEFERNVMNFLPDGWEPAQIDPRHPATTNEQFQRSELTYFARCCNMPYSLAAGTSRDSNFSSAKMDIKNTWEPEVKTEQEKMSRDVMAPIFRWFLEDIAISTDILDNAPMIAEIDYQFYWPPLPQADEIDETNAAATRVESGLSNLPAEFARNGLDWEASMLKAATAYGVSVDEYKRALFNKTFGVTAPLTPDPAAAPADASSAGAFVGTRRRDFLNNQKATSDVLSAFMDGTSEAMTLQSLIRLGWSQAAAQSLIEDARDGVVDTPDLEPANV